MPRSVFNPNKSERDDYHMFEVKKPCKDCPFRKDSFMRHALGEGRMEEIVSSLLQNDHHTFTCHKTIDYENDRLNRKDEQLCMGSLVYLQKLKRPSVIQRVGYMTGALDYQEVNEMADLVLDEEDVNGLGNLLR